MSDTTETATTSDDDLVTEDDQTQQAPETAPEAAQEAEDATDAPQGEDGGPSREAARYRRRLRDTEQERDQLATQVEVMQRAEAERIAAQTIKNATALWAAGTQLSDLLNDDGTVNTEKVTDAAKAATETLGLARQVPGNYVPREGRNPRPPQRDNMASVIAGM